MSLETVQKYVVIEPYGTSASGKTKVWAVRNTKHDVDLGFIRWHGAWRKYVYHSPELTFYDHDCLRLIADFCEAATKEHYAD